MVHLHRSTRLVPLLPSVRYEVTRAIRGSDENKVVVAMGVIPPLPLAVLGVNKSAEENDNI